MLIKHTARIILILSVTCLILNIKAKADWVIGQNSTLNIGQDCYINVSGDLKVDSLAELNNSGDLYFSGDLINNGNVSNVGEISTNKMLNNVSAFDPGNLGAVITSSTNLGDTKVTWGGTAQTITTGKGMERYYDIEPTNNIGLDATLEFTYLQSEVTNIQEWELALGRSVDAGATWEYREGNVDTVGNTITLYEIDAFSRWTAAAINIFSEICLSKDSLDFEYQIIETLADTVLPVYIRNCGYKIITIDSLSDMESPFSYDFNVPDTIIIGDSSRLDIICNRNYTEGVYVDTLIIYNNDSIIKFKIQSILVNSFPVVDLRNDYKHCIGNTDTLTADILGGSAPFAYLWSTGENTQSIYIDPDVDSTFWVEITDYYGLKSSDTVNVSIQNVYEDEEICMVTVDSASQRNIIVWKKTPGEGTAFYKIYRIPDVIDTVPYDSLSVSIDLWADPLAQAWQYFITAVDSCGNESDSSTIHQTIYLTAVSDLSGNVSLEWTKYIGFDYEYYYIYRGESLFDLTLIDSVYYTYSTVYTDVNPPPLEFHYRVVVRKDTGSICSPSIGKAASGPFKQSLSNIGDGGVDYQFQVKIFLEGPFHNGQMLLNQNFEEVIQRTQPFNTYPWYYEGEEQVDSVPNYVVDWILFELRKSTYGPWSAGEDTRIYRQAAFLNKFGYIVDLDGLSNLHFNAVLSNYIYIVLNHRNHIGIMAGIPLNIENTYISYNFTNNPDKFYGNFYGYSEIVPGIYGMASGDFNKDGFIDLYDKDNCWILNVGKTGYLFEDGNFDGQVNNIDKNDYWLPNVGKGCQVPE